VDRRENGRWKRSFFTSREEAEAEADRIRSLFKTRADAKAYRKRAKAEADANLIRSLVKSRGEAEADRIRAGWSSQTPTVDLNRPMTVEQFASWLGVPPYWVRRHFSVLPGVIRHNRNVVRIIPRFYVELAGSTSPKGRKRNPRAPNSSPSPGE
jgi:hypothetical protein